MIDEVGSPRLERLLQQVPATAVIGHGLGFWAEIGADRAGEAKSGFTGPIVEEGSLPRLLRSHPRLCADLSAASGLHAIARDEAYGVRFLTESQDRLLFQTDTYFGDAQGRRPNLKYLCRRGRRGYASSSILAQITGGKAQRLLHLL